ncbi:unnamed protein product [Arabis nemorensis]|uniref:Uncharacterized protein n=1 Tax=Arabis nemorensis TaxID=586526 RepID=A0A565C4G0_9BRAS|nr:unnamed protein product [Arabis nemorensis]
MIKRLLKPKVPILKLEHDQRVTSSSQTVFIRGNSVEQDEAKVVLAKEKDQDFHCLKGAYALLVSHHHDHQDRRCTTGFTFVSYKNHGDVLRDKFINVKWKWKDNDIFE